VDAYSALGRGTEFVVHLPLALPSESQPRSAKAKVARKTGPSLRVLVVDDNVDSASSIAMILRIQGYDVCSAYSGEDALRTAVEFRPDIILLDIGLPIMDGYEVARRLRRKPQFKNTRLVAITGYGQESDRWKAREVGFDQHLLKPITPKDLLDVIAAFAK
jgi:two-component system, chemotaxis family, CheB/CheR fusion protein